MTALIDKTDYDIMWGGKNKCYVNLTHKEVAYLIERTASYWGETVFYENRLHKKLQKALKLFKDMEKLK